MRSRALPSVCTAMSQIGRLTSRSRASGVSFGQSMIDGLYGLKVSRNIRQARRLCASLPSGIGPGWPVQWRAAWSAAATSAGLAAPAEASSNPPGGGGSAASVSRGTVPAVMAGRRSLAVARRVSALRHLLSVVPQPMARTGRNHWRIRDVGSRCGSPTAASTTASASASVGTKCRKPRPVPHRDRSPQGLMNHPQRFLLVAGGHHQRLVDEPVSGYDLNSQIGRSHSLRPRSDQRALLCRKHQRRFCRSHWGQTPEE